MKIALLLLLVVFAAGCTGLSGIFGGDVLSIKQNIIQDGQKDILVVKDVATIPTSPMLPNQPFVFSFLVENVDNSEIARDVTIELFNAPTVKSDAGQVCNTGSGSICKADKCWMVAQPQSAALQGPIVNVYPGIQMSGDKCTILPGEQVPINFYLRTPTEKEIVNIETKPTLDYRILYNFESTSLFVMPSVDFDEILKNQRSNDKVDVQVTKSYGTGPVRVEMELFGTLYILSGQSATLIFKVVNTGGGNVVGSQIKERKFVVEIPKDMVAPDGKIILPDGQTYSLGAGVSSPDRFDCSATGTHYRCTNIKALDIYKDQTRGSLRFQITNTKSIAQPFLSYDIRASTEYSYELRGTQEITVKPFES